MAKTLETVQWRRKPKADRHGDTAPVDAVEVLGVRVAPRSSDESAGRDNLIVTGYTLLWPPTAPGIPAAEDEVLVRGLWCAVEGLPFDTGRKGALVTVKGVGDGSA